jgi:uncharacterized protein YwgA
MDNYQRYSIILRVIDKLRIKESWCGETHIQKAIYFLQEVTEVNTGYDFILYKHGPYSFDLSDELRSMRADKYLDLEPTPPYGGCFTAEKRGTYLKENYMDHINQFENQIDFVADTIGNLRVVDLEKLSTALYITKEKQNLSVQARANYMNRLKPHISIGEARDFIQRIGAILNRVEAE